MKVYGKMGFTPDAPGKQVWRVVAAPSLKAAAKLFGCSLYEMTSYGGQTWNHIDLEAAGRYPKRVVLWVPDERSHRSANHYQPESQQQEEA